MKRSPYTAEQFVRTWQTAATLRDVYDALPESTKPAIRARARSYRVRGVPLKRLEGEGTSLDVDALTALAIGIQEASSE